MVAMQYSFTLPADYGTVLLMGKIDTITIGDNAQIYNTSHPQTAGY